MKARIKQINILLSWNIYDSLPLTSAVILLLIISVFLYYLFCNSHWFEQGQKELTSHTFMHSYQYSATFESDDSWWVQI